MDQWNALQQLLAHMQANAAPRENTTPGGGSSTNALMSPQGMPGTPGGPVQESPLMQSERDNQRLLGLLGSMAGGGVGGAIGGMPGFLLGMVPGMAARGNSGLPNIRDVWSDQLRMRRQEQAREEQRQADQLKEQFSGDTLARALRGY